jgi:hypothetical protein
MKAAWGIYDLKRFCKKDELSYKSITMLTKKLQHEDLEHMTQCGGKKLQPYLLQTCQNTGDWVSTDMFQWTYTTIIHLTCCGLFGSQFDATPIVKTFNSFDDSIPILASMAPSIFKKNALARRDWYMSYLIEPPFIDASSLAQESYEMYSAYTTKDKMGNLMGLIAWIAN